MILTLIILYSVLFVVVTVTLTAIVSSWIVSDNSDTPQEPVKPLKRYYEDTQ